MAALSSAVLAMIVVATSLIGAQFHAQSVRGCDNSIGQLLSPFRFSCDTGRFSSFLSCPWPVANIGFRLTVTVFSIFALIVMFVMGIRKSGHFVKIRYALLALCACMFAVGCVDANALRIGNNFCLSKFVIKTESDDVRFFFDCDDIKCDPGVLVGMIFADWILSALLLTTSLLIHPLRESMSSRQMSRSSKVSIPVAE
eukprot:c12386_g2_i1.p1 GENE.c12386_g2_i1~~c12386_g2_i1.p1  ORF type:complete len:229 (+),score=20.64 c12386_g2_i1:91-687(+)